MDWYNLSGRELELEPERELGTVAQVQLTEMGLSGMHLSQVDLTKANLTGTKLAEVDLQEKSFAENRWAEIR